MADDDLVDSSPSSSVSATAAWSTGLREVTSALISVGIAGTSFYFLWDTFADAQATSFNEQAFVRQKDLLLLALGLLGTVTGYYLGRLPAEQEANAARKQANSAETTARDALQGQAKARAALSESIMTIEAELNEKGGGADGAEALALRALRRAERQLYLG